jgi:hypothetical protein
VFPTFSIIDLFQAQCCNAWDQIPIFEIVVGFGVGVGEGGGVTGGVLPFWPNVPSSVNFSSELCVKDLCWNFRTFMGAMNRVGIGMSY